MKVTHLTHLKIIIICLLSCSLYIFLYVGATVGSLKIKESVDQLQEWSEGLRNTLLGISKNNSEPKSNETLLNLISERFSNRTLTLPILTLFTSFVTKPEKYECYNLTLYNWNLLKPYVVLILFTNEKGLQQEATRKGWTVLPIRVTGTKDKIPVLKNLYLEAMKVSNTTYYAFANGDILFTDSLISTLLDVYSSGQFNFSIPILLIGQRINVDNLKKEEARTKDNIIAAARKRGSLFTISAEDYFITTRRFPWHNIPDVIIGRVAYDNWLVWFTRYLGYPTVDVTSTLLAVHQTTKAGNFEGRDKKESDFNKNILSRLYHSVRYEAGFTSCADYVTKNGADGKFQILKRRRTRYCSL